MLDTCVIYFLMHIKFISYQKKKHWIAHHLKSSCSPPSHTGESCSRDKGQMPQLSPRGTLELLVLSAAVSFLFFFNRFLHSFILNDWLVPRTHQALSGSRTLYPPSPSSAQDSTRTPAYLLSGLGFSLMLGRESFPGGGAELCPPRRLCLSCLDCIILKWSSFFMCFTPTEGGELLFEGWGKSILFTIVFLVFTIIPNIQEWFGRWIEKQIYGFLKEMNITNT